jgi:hypothetical protein
MKFPSIVVRRKKHNLPSVLDYEALASVLAGKPSMSTLSGPKYADHTDSSHSSDFQQPKSDLVVDWKLLTFDSDTTKDQTIEHELERLIALQSFNILENEREEVFDRITSLAADIFQTPITTINLVDLGRTWFVSGHGTGDLDGTPRSISFCAHVIASKVNRPLIVPDLKEDFRFNNFPTVMGPPYLRFYAGAPLISPEGYKLGALCIMDVVPRRYGLTDVEEEILIDLAAMAMKIMVERRDKMQEYANKINQDIKYCGSSCFDSLENMLGPPVTNMHKLVQSLNILVDPLPKHVPLTIELDPKIPVEINCNDVILLRASLLLLSNSAGRTESGSVHMMIGFKNKRIVFECKDTGPVISTKKNEVKNHFESSSKPSTLSAMAALVRTLNGEYGIDTGPTSTEYATTIFWFSLHKKSFNYSVKSNSYGEYGSSLLTLHTPNQSNKTKAITSKMKHLDITTKSFEGICSMPDCMKK